MTKAKLTKRAVDALIVDSTNRIVWDDAIPGFGLRIRPSGKKTFVLRYRPRGNSALKRYVTLGHYGVVTVEQARAHARRLLGDVANGKDPAAVQLALKAAPTLSEVAREFLLEHVSKKRKALTLESYENALRAHVIPKLGLRKLCDVTTNDVSKVHASLSHRPYVANKVLQVLSSLYGWAALNGYCAEGVNPARRVQRYKERKRQRFLSPAEFERLGAALHEAETIGLEYSVDTTKPTAKHAVKPENRRVRTQPDAVAAIRLLMLTGCRLREILHLRWSEVDLHNAVLLLADSKTGERTVLLNSAAVEVLQGLERQSEFVFPGAQLDQPRSDLKRPWAAVTRRAGLHGLRLHDLRHSFASVAVNAHVGLPIIGALLGHSQPGTTARYAHIANHPARAATDAVGAEIGRALRPNHQTLISAAEGSVKEGISYAEGKDG